MQKMSFQRALTDTSYLQAINTFILVYEIVYKSLLKLKEHEMARGYF